MHRITKNNIAWFLEADAPDGLDRAVSGIVEEADVRRGYASRPLGDKKIFVKFFLERGLWGALRNRLMPRGRKEYDLAKRILAHAIATPRPLGYGIGAGGSFIVQEWVDGRTLRSALAEGPAAAAKGALLDALARLLRQLADARIRHNDLHLDNVLLCDGRLYLIDLHKARVVRSFGREDAASNLAQALSMVHKQMTEDQRARFFEAAGRPDLRTPVEAALKAQWGAWIESKKRRAFSDTSKLAVRGRRVYVRGSEEEGRGAFAGFLKEDRKVRVERYADHVRKVYLRRRRLKRAWENWAALEYVTGDIVPRPFYVERPSLFRDGFVAMEDLGGRGEELDRFLDRRYDAMETARRRAFIGSLARFLGRLLDMGIVHKDMKACNIFVLDDGFRLLDVEDTDFHAPEEEDLLAMLVQLNTSVPRRIKAPDRMRFLLGLARVFPFDKKRTLRRVSEACAGADIIYEGVSGLKRE
jgi:tRNA A-37 threonylcarbamoyl transferase component Bud32